MTTALILKWVMLLALFGGVFWWTNKQNRDWQARISAHRGDIEHRALFNALLMRGYVVIGLCASLVTLNIFFDTLYLLQERTPETSAPVSIVNESPRPAPAATVPYSTASAALTDLFAEEETGTQDRIKRRYEEMLVSYLYLERCGLAENDLLAEIRSHLRQEGAATGEAPDALESRVFSAARGTYEGLFSQSACDVAQAERLKAQIEAQLAKP